LVAILTCILILGMLRLMKKLNPLFLSYIELSLAQLFLGFNVIFGKLLAPVFPIATLLALRFFIGFTFIALYLGLTSFSELCLEVKRLKRSNWTILFLQAGCGGFLFNILTLYGLQYTTATVTSIISSTIPAFVGLFSFLILKEKLTKGKTFAILLTIIGILLLSFRNVVFNFESKELYGLFFVLLAIIPASLFTIFAKMSENTLLRPLTVTLIINLINLVLFCPMAMNDEWSLFFQASSLEWLEILIYSVSGSLLFFVFWYRGLKYTTANTAALFVGVMPISTCMLAYFFLNEVFSWFDMLGMTFVIVSILIGTLEFRSGSFTTSPIAKPLFNL
jgi:drug/metabolite transporter (DMT)-like permease